MNASPAPIALAAPAGFPLAALVARANLLRANAQFLAQCHQREAQWAASPLFRQENSQG